jgi:hypothetical protein
MRKNPSFGLWPLALGAAGIAALVILSKKKGDDSDASVVADQGGGGPVAPPSPVQPAPPVKPKAAVCTDDTRNAMAEARLAIFKKHLSDNLAGKSWSLDVEFKWDHTGDFSWKVLRVAGISVSQADEAVAKTLQRVKQVANEAKEDLWICSYGEPIKKTVRASQSMS